MKLVPYKPKQGLYARYSVAGAMAVLLLFAAWRTTRFLGFERTFPVIGLSIPYSAMWGGALFVVLGLLATLLLTGCRTGIQRIDTASSALIDLLIDTENELQKVSWPGREELRRYTIVVIACILVLGGLIYSVDFVVSYTMSGLGVLPV